VIIQDVLDLAKYSELSGVAIKDNTPAIVLFMNAAMLELHKRFPLKVEEHVIPLIEGTTTYTLPTNFLYPLEAYGEVSEATPYAMPPRIPINEEADISSIFFPNHTQVQVPLSNDGAFISLVYAAKPPRYDENDVALELDLPETLIEPLMQYMGYKAHSGISSGVQDENNVHYQRFDRSCKKARELGVAYPLDSWSMTNRLLDRGFP